MGKKRLHNENSEPDGTVVLNCHNTPEREFTFIAEAYHLVAKEAVEKLREKPGFGLYGNPVDDFRAYPIMFLYRHSLELYMKAIILLASPMLEIKKIGKIKREKLFNTHTLGDLLKDIENVIKAYEWDWDFGTQHFHTLQDFQNIISTIDEVDKGFAFRYPIDKKGSASLDPLRFNLFKFCEILDELIPVFEGIILRAYEELQTTYEMMDELNQWGIENSNQETF